MYDMIRQDENKIVRGEKTRSCCHSTFGLVLFPLSDEEKSQTALDSTRPTHWCRRTVSPRCCWLFRVVSGYQLRQSIHCRLQQLSNSFPRGLCSTHNWCGYVCWFAGQWNHCTTWSSPNPVVRSRLQLPVQPSERGMLFNGHEEGFYNLLSSTICDGFVERFNGTLAQGISMCVSSDQKDWDKFLNPVLFAYRVSPSEVTSESPFNMRYGREPRLPTDVSLLPPREISASIAKHRAAWPATHEGLPWQNGSAPQTQTWR